MACRHSFFRRSWVYISLTLGITVHHSAAFLTARSVHCSETLPGLSFVCKSCRNAAPSDRDTATVGSDELSFSGLSAILSQKPLPTNASKLQMLSFYHFSPLDDPLAVRDELFQRVSSIPGLRGTIYLAPEGINAQLAVPCGEPLQDLVEICRATLPFDPLQENLPNLGDLVDITTPTFDKLVVRARDAILRDGMDETLDWTDAGSELSPGEWDHQLRSEANKPLVLLDCRNLYEFVQGTFHGATPLMTSNFQESWSELKERTQGLSKDQPLHIFCTGGIRCVKVGAYLKQKLGFSDIRRLEHGIIGYQRWSREEHLLSDESLWFGENFLFDKRRFHKRESD